MSRKSWLGAGTVVGGLAGAVWLRPMSVLDTVLRLKLWASGARTEWVEVEGRRVHVLRAPAEGVADGVPLLLIHGLGARTLDWVPLIPGLQAAGHAVLALDLLGYGLSDKPRDAVYTIAEQERVVAGVLRELGVGPVDVAGWSMGGWIALKLAADQPERVRRLVLFDSAGMDFQMDYAPALFMPKNVAGMRRLLERLTPKANEVPDFLLRDLLRRARTNRWVMERSVQEMLRGGDLMQFRLGEIRQRTLIFWGEEDRLIPIEAGERMAAGITGSRLVRLPDCGHLAPTECADAVLPEMTRFLQGE